MKDYAEEAEEFKLKHIYPNIASTEHKEGTTPVCFANLQRCFAMINSNQI
ncbi:hypothetical protein HanRHA438_Chr17g0829241 [Helianthus annuus]|nr:hypothetical protein HanIR_Chr17g0889441 [Helianthus annuus]KAJ0827737.1 hypothetical protein HanRHA438_Chr17g0829241 [Helianthus annuus]